jgi:AmmeMemoRadiSam system protein A
MPAFFFISILISNILGGINLLYAKDAGRPVMKILSSQTSPDQTMGKEGVMIGKEKLTENEGMYLLSEARRTIENSLFNKDKGLEHGSYMAPKFSERRGTFVTLTIDGRLRGCIGHIIPNESLIEGVRINAINAAFRDPRFRPVSKKEWEKVHIEISILTEPEILHYSDAVDLLDKLRPGIDGVIIKKGSRQATFLPQVWEQLSDKKEFLAHLCLKAGMEGNAWKKGDIEVSIYEVQAFEEH